MDNEMISKMGFMMEQALGSMTSLLAAGFKAQGIDLPYSQYAVLRLLYTCNEPLTQIKIAEILKKDASAIKRTVDILERKGLVERKALNGRTNCVICTDKAFALKDAVTATANETLQMIFCDFTNEELKDFANILNRISESKNG